MTKTAFVFPGQGSQRVGMGKSLFENSVAARRVFEEADKILGWSLSELMFVGPGEELLLTKNAQPAILTHSVAALRALSESDVGLPDYVCGHSLGEFSALVAAQVLDFETALKMVTYRGEVMQNALPAGKGAMAAILGMDAIAIKESCTKISNLSKETYVAVANYNGPFQTVIAGLKEGVEAACLSLKAQGAKRAIVLPVSAPFHSQLMLPAEKSFQDYLDSQEFCKPKYPIIMNLWNGEVSNASEVRESLKGQIVEPVNFTETMNKLHANEVKNFIEIGPSSLLSIMKRMHPECAHRSIAKITDL